MPDIFFQPHYSVICKHLGEGLLVLAVLEGVDEGVDDGRHPREDGGDRVEQGEPHLVVVGHSAGRDPVQLVALVWESVLPLRYWLEP